MVDYPPIEKGWKTPNMMKAAYGGHDQVWNERMRSFAKYLAIEKEIELGITRKEAKALVEKEYAGMRTNRGREAFALSSKAQDMLLAMLPKMLEKDWDTVNTLHNEWGVSDAVVKDHLLRLEEQLTQDITAALNIRYEDAKQLVNDHLIGDRKPRRGPSTIAAGPDAKRILAEQVILQVPDKWATPKNMSEMHGASEKQWKQRMEKEEEALPGRIAEATGMDLLSATRHVDDTMIGLRIPVGGGNPVLAASPQMQKLLVEKYAAKDGPRR